MTTEEPKELTFDTLVSLCKRRGFVFPSSEIYGGIGGFWDYGPLGVEMKNNIKRAWWRAWSRSATTSSASTPSIIMNPRVWEASGHVAHLHRPHGRLQELQAPLPRRPPRRRRLPRLRRQGPVHRGAHLQPHVQDLRRPRRGRRQPVSTCAPRRRRRMFVNFDNVVTSMRRKLPFGIAQIGRSFRNEITPGNFIFRDREFEQMEMEYFCKPGTDEQWHEHWIEHAPQLVHEPRRPRRRTCASASTSKEELSHYSQGHLRHRVPLRADGLVRARRHRQPHRLRPQGARARAAASALTTSTKSRNEHIVPYVIEPALGVDRCFLVMLYDAYREEEVTRGEKRVVLQLHPAHRADQGRRAAALAQREAGAARAARSTPSCGRTS